MRFLCDKGFKKKIKNLRTLLSVVCQMFEINLVHYFPTCSLLELQPCIYCMVICDYLDELYLS